MVSKRLGSVLRSWIVILWLPIFALFALPRAVCSARIAPPPLRPRTRPAQIEDDIAIDTFLCHELSNAVTVLQVYTEILMRKTDELSGTTAYIIQNCSHYIHEATNDLEALITATLSLQRVDGNSVQMAETPVYLQQYISEIVSTYAPLFDKHQLHVGLPSTPCFAIIDELRVREILLNILRNATKYSPKGSQVTLLLEFSDDNIYISIADNGAGIPAMHLEKVFDRGWRRNPDSPVEGLGIGLYIARKLARAHGGDLRAIDVATGARFELTLPRVPATMREPAVFSLHEELEECPMIDESGSPEAVSTISHTTVANVDYS